MKANQGVSPTKTLRFWLVLSFFFAVVMVLTMLKDFWLTAEKPNILFYIFVPTLSILGGVVSMYGAAKIGRQDITFLTMLAISMGANTLMQVVENIMKITYYLIWAYPGLLYIILVLPLGFILVIYGLIRWGKVKSWMAVILAFIDFVGNVATSTLLTDVIGLTTPGS
jgi:hypothetical protein